MDTFSIVQLLTILVILSGVAVLVRFTKRRSPQNTEPPKGVGGWLIIPIIGFVGVIILTSMNLFAAVSEIEGLKLIVFGDDPQFKPLKLPVALSLIFGVAVIISASICLYKIAFSKLALRKVAIFHYCLLAFTCGVEVWADGVIVATVPGTPADPQIQKDAIRSLVALLIWVPYFLYSKRVENTFEAGSSNISPRGAIL